MLEEMRAQGYARARIDGELRRLDEQIELDKKFKHDISVVVDRLVMKEGVRKRLAESIEAAVPARRRPGRGRDAVRRTASAAMERRAAATRASWQEPSAERGKLLLFSERFACLECGTSMPELEPRIFSFNSPHGCCQRCHGLGFQRVIDPELIVPDPTLSISQGALRAVDEGGLGLPPAPARGGRRDQRDRRRHSLAGPHRGRPRAAARRHRRASGTRSATATASAAGASTPCASTACSTASSAATRTPTPSNTRERIEGLMALQPCPACGGARLRPESLAVTVGGLNIHEYTRAVRARRAGVDRASWS